MPLYDYAAPCGHTFEALGKPEAPRACPCGTPGCEATPQIGAPAFALKGSGFYDSGRGVAGKSGTP